MATQSAARLLRELRVARGESLRAAARQLGVDPSYLSRLERGEKTPSPDLQQRAARYYDVPSEVLGLAEGRVPSDIVEILRDHPELLEKIRAEYGS
jgi:transcriptional regulator with XRE-family HTH domain